MENNMTTVNNAIQRGPELIAAEIRALTGQVLSAFLEIGRRFVEAKELLPHGEFGAWVREQTGYSMSTANNCMRLYREYGEDQGSLFGASSKSQTFENLGYAKALALLEVPAEEREEFAEAVDAEGLSVRELRAAIRERDDKIAEAENVAEGYRLKLESEKLEKESLLREKTEVMETANAELARLRQELLELQNAPREAIVQTVVDEEAVKEAAQEAREAAEKELRAKIAKAEKERDKAVAEREKAEKAKAKAERDLAEKSDRDSSGAAAEKALEAANAQLAELQKKLALADSPEKVAFRFWFEQGQACVNNMLDCLGKLRTDGKKEDADKLNNALRVFLDKALLYTGTVED